MNPIILPPVMGLLNVGCLSGGMAFEGKPTLKLFICFAQIVGQTDSSALVKQLV